LYDQSGNGCVAVLIRLDRSTCSRPTGRAAGWSVTTHF